MPNTHRCVNVVQFLYSPVTHTKRIELLLGDNGKWIDKRNGTWEGLSILVWHLQQRNTRTWWAHETGRWNTDVNGQLANNVMSFNILFATRHIQMGLNLHNDLAGQYTQCAPVIPGFCCPKVAVEMTHPVEIHITDRIIANVDNCILPCWRKART